MQTGFATNALLPTGWAKNVRFVIANGRFETIDADSTDNDTDWRCEIAIAGIPNLHSHAFQRGMAGMAERRARPADSFWTWRTLMYRLALRVTPEQMEAIAGQLYVEMLAAGYTQVAEFHYLHNDLDGTSYADPSEMAQRLANAAETAGIGMLLLPTLYAQSGFDAAPLSAEQRRFRSDPERIGRIVEAVRARGSISLDAGVALHSLRAATIEAMRETCAIVRDGPIHIHVAEQQAEVAACVASTGCRPVSLLLDRMPVDARWCLIHATHVTQEESLRIAQSGAVVGLCPITEGNLGDGIFPLPDLLDAGGRFGIGSDSNVLVSPGEELRLLEYGQRLARQVRCVALPAGRVGSVGRALLDQAVAGGAAACGLAAEGLARHGLAAQGLAAQGLAAQGLAQHGLAQRGLAPQGLARHGLSAGARADLVVLEPDDLALPGLEQDAILDSALFACARLPVRDVMCAGRFVIQAGRHAEQEAIASRFRAAMYALLAA